MLVFGHKGFPVILIPPGKGRYFDAKDQGIIDSVSSLLNSGYIKIYCPDTIDHQSFLNSGINPFNRIKTHNAYESVLLFDVLAFARYETGINKVAMAGMGLGAYHCLNTAFRNPERVSYILSMGGFFDIKRFLDGFYDDNVYFNNPVDYLPGLNDPWYLNRIKQMSIKLDTGEWDHNLQENYHFSEILSAKSIEHNLNIRQNTGHDWHWWREMFAEYMYYNFG